MGQQFLSSRMCWEDGNNMAKKKGKACVNGPNTIPVMTTQMYMGPDQTNHGNLYCFHGIRSVSFSRRSYR